jgi:hypothetical protein
MVVQEEQHRIILGKFYMANEMFNELDKGLFIHPMRSRGSSNKTCWDISYEVITKMFSWKEWHWGDEGALGANCHCNSY